LTPSRISSIFFLGRYDLLLAPFGDSERIMAFVALCPNERASNASLWHFCLVQAKDADMRDFRNAKTMAQTLRAALSSKGTKITVSESLELVAKMFGVTDWNTLAATIRSGAGRKNISPQLLPVVGSDPALPFSVALVATLHQALGSATQRKHEYATLEHLLLALIDDADASAALKVCNADLGALTAKLVDYLDTGLKVLVIDNGWDARPTAAFQRVAQRAGLRGNELGLSTVTGANILEAIFFETQSPAARLLGEQGMTRQDLLNIIAHGRGWHYMKQLSEGGSKEHR
jgi:Glyoxalase superfamily protein/Clp amino terminal domain, pathogenicity island component